jgi:hypothetical protein
MSLPHSSRFSFRPALFWSLTLIAGGLAARASSLSGRGLAVAFLAAAGLAVAVHVYARWLAGIESRFRRVHPRTFRGTMLAMFYGCSGVSLLLLTLSPWLARWWPASPLGAATGYFLAPVFLAAAAGFIGVWHKADTVA